MGGGRTRTRGLASSPRTSASKVGRKGLGAQGCRDSTSLPAPLRHGSMLLAALQHPPACWRPNGQRPSSNARPLSAPPPHGVPLAARATARAPLRPRAEPCAMEPGTPCVAPAPAAAPSRFSMGAATSPADERTRGSDAAAATPNLGSGTTASWAPQRSRGGAAASPADGTACGSNAAAALPNLGSGTATSWAPHRRVSSADAAAAPPRPGSGVAAGGAPAPSGTLCAQRSGGCTVSHIAPPRPTCAANPMYLTMTPSGCFVVGLSATGSQLASPAKAHPTCAPSPPHLVGAHSCSRGLSAPGSPAADPAAHAIPFQVAVPTMSRTATL